MLFAATFTIKTANFQSESNAAPFPPINSYCEQIAFPLLFGLLLLAAIIFPRCHWRAKVAAKQAQALTKIESIRADPVAESAKMRTKAQLEREHPTPFENEIELGNDKYVEKLKRYARMKKDEHEALLEIPVPFRKQIADPLGLDLSSANQDKAAKPTVAWQGNRMIERGN